MKISQIEKDWKYYTGMVFLFLSLVFPLLGFFVPLLNLSKGMSAVLIGSLTIGGPELMIILAVIFLGKPVFEYYKAKLFKLFKRKRAVKPVSKTRYHVGLILFFGSPFALYINAYAPGIMPAHEMLRYNVLVFADLIFVLSFFVLGGEFWEKFKKLFIWNAKA